jgi:DNA repair protein RecN (Recombination protein N)
MRTRLPQNYPITRFGAESRIAARSSLQYNPAVLLELRVENYAVIDNVVVEFAPGLNLLTGETGAGKSLLIDALALLMGEKASSELVRHGAERAVVAGVFEAEEQRTAPVLEGNGLDGNGSELILRREIAAEGKSRVFVNNQPATVGVLKQLAPLLAAIHSQTESMFAFAFDASARVALLDSFAGIQTAALAALHHRWRELAGRIAELQRNEQDRARLLDLWTFQKKEIEQAHLEAGEDRQLETERNILANAERIYTAAMSAYQQLYENNGSALALLRSAARQVEDLARFDERFQDTIAALETARITVEDASSGLRQYAGGVNASPERLAEVEDRLAVIARLKRKYGTSIEEIIAYGQEIARKLGEIENRDQIVQQLGRQHAAAAAEYLALAREFSRQRFEAARSLERLVEAEINDLAMKARFKIEVSGHDGEESWTPAGFDRVAYLIAANPGQPLGAVEQIASGGELSRVMLAIKMVASRRAASFAGAGPARSTETTLVFDEIDAGIGGRAAEAVGRKLKSLARGNQVLCITHLPQIACFADHHFSIEKRDSAGRTRVVVRRLSGEQRIQEIARMLSGAKITDVALKNASEMLKANA